MPRISPTRSATRNSFHHARSASLYHVHFAWMAASTEWKKCSMLIAMDKANLSWGKAGDRLRMDFGSQSGVTLQIKDLRIRVMTDYRGRRIKEAGPSVPVEITGMGEVPGAGDDFPAVADERMARELVEQRKHDQKNAAGSTVGKVTLEDLFSQIQAGEIKNLNIIVKADVQGSAEAVKSSLEKLSNDEVRVRVIHCAVGAISESDVMLAATSGAIIVGFNVRPDSNAKESAARSGVDMRMYRVIYDAINEIETAMKGMLAPKFKEVELGRAEVRNVFRITGVGMVAGCYVVDGKMQRGAQMRLLRDNIVIYDGAIASLQRFKDSVKEVAAGYECGITFEKFQDIKEGDVIEAFLMEQIEV